ncbi:MAG: hypothetical protein ACR2QO_03515 [Acidimicrobiales bacterium]
MDNAKQLDRSSPPLSVDVIAGGDATTSTQRPDQLDNYVKETLAANAAVVLAKTQATAARAESRDLNQRAQGLAADLDAERTARDEAEQQLIAARREQALIERDRAVAEARADEVRKQLEQERVERSILLTRIIELEAERDDAVGALGWWSRRRLTGRRTAPSRATIQPALD